MKYSGEAAENSLDGYRVLRIGDAAYEGHKNKQFAYGRFVVNDFANGIISSRFRAIRPKVILVNLFWKYYLHNEQVIRPILIRSTKLGTMMNELVPNDLFKQTVVIPRKNEQIAIGNFFRTIDQLIAAAQRQKSLLKHKKQAYLQQIFQLGMRIFQHCASKDLLTHGSNESCPMRRRLLWVRHLKAVHIRMNHLNMYLFKEIRISKMEQSFPGIGRHKKHAKFHQGQYCLAFELRLELSRVPVLMWFLVEVSQE